MARQKKDGKLVNFYMDVKLVEELEKYCEETGMSKTTAVERFIKEGLEKKNSKMS